MPIQTLSRTEKLRFQTTLSNCFLTNADYLLMVQKINFCFPRHIYLWGETLRKGSESIEGKKKWTGKTEKKKDRLDDI